MKVEAPERIWIESEGECPYFYHEEELSDVAPPITEYVRADKLEELAAEVEALRAAMLAAAPQQTASVDEVKETDLWRCTVCGRVGTVGRCCGEETRERVNMEQLLAENERLRDEVERLRTDGASAVRWAPSSAHWSEVLKELFGPDARNGIDVLETRWRKELERAERLAEALRELEDRVQRDEALLRKAAHPAITHCDNCGCDWLDNGLNPIGCPYCKQPEAVDKAMVKRFTIAFQNTPGDEAIDANEKVVRRWLAAALDIQHQEPTT